jgi:hypothetical protein
VQLFYTNQLLKSSGKQFKIDSSNGSIAFKLSI